MREIGFGIVGCGMIAQFHIDAIARIEGARVAGVYDQDEESAARASLACAAPAFAGLDDLLAHEAVDAVCVCTPNGLHAQLALRALDSGKHVVVEKPLAIRREDVDAVIAASERTGKLVCVISQLRFSPAVQAVRAALDQGLLGQVVSASLSMKYFRDAAYYGASGWRGTWAMDGGGALMNQGIHGVDLLQYLAGPVRRVTALCKTQTRKIEVEDSAAAILEFAGGAIGVLEASTTCYPGYPRRLEICGDQGGVILEEDAILRWDLDAKRPAPERSPSGAARDPAAIDRDGHERQLRNMVGAIRGTEALLVDAREGGKPVEIILAIYESARSGRGVELRGRA